MITFDYFTMHNSAWFLLNVFIEKFTRIHGVEFLQYIPQEDKLPFVVGYTFSTAAGRKGLKDEEKAQPVDSFLNVAAESIREFLIKGQGRAGWRSIPRPPSTAWKGGNGWPVHPFPSIPQRLSLHNPSIPSSAAWNGFVEMEAASPTGPAAVGSGRRGPIQQPVTLYRSHHIR
jgi:hypothetical protein